MHHPLRQHLFTLSAVCCLAAVLVTPGRSFATGAVAVETVRVPHGGIHPQAQVDSRGRVHLIYFRGDPLHGDAFYVRSDDDLRTFSDPVRVNSHPGSVVIVGSVRGPHLAIGRDDRVHVAWMGSDAAEPRAAGKQTPMLYARISDAGDGFEPQRNIVRRHTGLDGGGSIAADGEGNVYVAWHAPPAGTEGEESRQVWVARSRDDGKTFDEESAALPAPTGTCACCGIRVGAADGGRVFVVYRSATAHVHRDIHLLASADHGRTFRVAAVDPWEVGTCVMSTAAIANAGDDLLAAWETKDQVRLATLPATADARADAPRQPAPDTGAAGRRKHPALAVGPDGGGVIAWTEGTGWNKGGSVAWQAFDAAGRWLPDTAGRAAGVPAWGVPAVVRLKDGSFRVIY